VDLLVAAGAGAQALASAQALMTDPWTVTHGLSLTREDRDGSRITTVGPPARLSATPVVPGAPASPPGADATDVLTELGLAGRLDQLVAEGALALE